MADRKLKETPTVAIKARKQWSELKGENSWTMFKVIAELVDGFEKLNKLDLVSRFLAQQEPTQKINIIKKQLRSHSD